MQSYVRTDLGLTWRRGNELDLSIGVRNANDPQHPEYGTDFLTRPTESERGVFFRARLRF